MAKKLWGGRFTKKQDPLFWEFQKSIDYDKELAKYDVQGSIAHVKMLDKCKIIPKNKAQSILSGLSQILKDIEKGVFKIDKNAEDIHTAVYLALQKKKGKAAEYLHTARSRNDQVVLDLMMYCKDKLDQLRERITQARMEHSEIGFKINGLIESVNDKFNINLTEVYGNFLEEDFSAQDVREKLEHQRTLRNRLGEVNLIAIQEHEALKERRDFIQTQRDDLLQSIDSITQAIRKINRTC